MEGTDLVGQQFRDPFPDRLLKRRRVYLADQSVGQRDQCWIDLDDQTGEYLPVLRHPISSCSSPLPEPLRT